MTLDTRIALFLMGELIAALRANDLDTFKRWLRGALEDWVSQQWKNYCWIGLPLS